MHRILRLLAEGKLAVALGLVVAAGFPLTGQESKNLEGVLSIEVEGHVVGTEHYRIVHAGSTIRALSEIKLDIGGQAVRQNTTLVLTPDYELRSYQWRYVEPQQISVRVEMQDGRARVTYPRPVDGKEEEQEFDFGTDRVGLLDVNVFHHFLLLVRLYDFGKGGRQTIPVLVPQSVQPGAVTVEAKGAESVEINGEKVLAQHLEVTTVDNQVLLWISDKKGIVRLHVPQANVTVQAQK